jgi:hypothetical protein
MTPISLMRIKDVRAKRVCQIQYRPLDICHRFSYDAKNLAHLKDASR